MDPFLHLARVEIGARERNRVVGCHVPHAPREVLRQLSRFLMHSKRRNGKRVLAGECVPPDPPTPAEVECSRLALASLPAEPTPHASLGIRGIDIELPAPAVKLLVAALVHLAEGNSVGIVVSDQRTEVLTTQQAADLLQISRPFLIKRIELGQLAFHMTGTHRRVRLADLLVFQQRLVDEQRGIFLP